MKSIPALLFGIYLAAVAGRAGVITLDAVNSGWYVEIGFSDGTVDNIAQTASHDGHVFRNWLGFDLSSVTDTITGATLEVASDPRNDGGQTVSWWDVTTPYANLGTNSVAIFDDLGSGILFATGGHTPGVVNSYTFNDAALTSLNATYSFWAIGGSNNGGAAFGYTQGVGSGDHLRLVLTTSSPVPDDGSTLALSGLAFGLLAWARRKLG